MELTCDGLVIRDLGKIRRERKAFDVVANRIKAVVDKRGFQRVSAAFFDHFKARRAKKLDSGRIFAFHASHAFCQNGYFSVFGGEKCDDLVALAVCRFAYDEPVAG